MKISVYKLEQGQKPSENPQNTPSDHTDHRNGPRAANGEIHKKVNIFLKKWRYYLPYVSDLDSGTHLPVHVSSAVTPDWSKCEHFQTI